MSLILNVGLSILVLSGLCHSHTLHLGRTCPNVVPFPNLSLSKVLGVWYVTYQFDTSSTCKVWDLKRSETNTEQLLLTESRQLYFLDAVGIDHKNSITAVIDIPNPEVPSKMRIRWPTSALTGKADFIIFDTDYENYLAIFQCDRAGLLHRRDVTVLSRTPDVDDMFIRRVRRLLETADVGHDALDKISQEQCRKSSSRNWHIDEKLFGLLPSGQTSNLKELSKGVADYDISQIEIIGDGIEQMSESSGNFRGSMTKGGTNI
ncbi:UNVERIFIED_CONTAM: hypothetical protein RMT77_001888 [Armadillidium vulgare]